jgi:DNA-directed RNA polymerase specialized sigma24 family protein
VLDPDAPSSQRALEAFEKPLARARIVSNAARITRSMADAEDLVNEAFARTLDPDDAPWVPDKISFSHHMRNLIRNKWCDEMRKHRATREVLDADLTTDDRTPGHHPRADEEIDRRRAMARWQTLVEGVLDEVDSDDPLARQVYELAGRGEDEASEQARILGCDVSKVYRAVEALKRHGKRALHAWELAEAKRMRDLQSAMPKSQATS